MLPHKEKKSDKKQCYMMQKCAIARGVFSRIGDKWSMLVILILQGGVKRFSEIKREIDGISQRMLTLTLRELERDGLVSRRVEATVPPSVYYDLTAVGKTLIEPAKNLAIWAEKNHAKILASQQKFDKENNKEKK